MKFSITFMTMILIFEPYVHGWGPSNQQCAGGFISIWYGPLEYLPKYYQICDGTNYTPDLRNRFIIGAGLDYHSGVFGGSYNIPIKVENLPAHNHIFDEVHTNDVHDGSHEHEHALKATIGDSAHFHGVTLNTDPDGHHYHEFGNVSVEPEYSHEHSIPTITTDVNGIHSHIMNAFIDDDYTQNKVTGVKAEFILDGAQPLDSIAQKYPDKVNNIQDSTQPDGQHSHTIPPSHTGPGTSHTHKISADFGPEGDHKHKVSGVTAEGGEHSHYVDGNIAGGGHHHSISGYTDYTGNDKYIYHMPPYHAVYFICCVGNQGSNGYWWNNGQYGY